MLSVMGLASRAMLVLGLSGVLAGSAVMGAYGSVRPQAGTVTTSTTLALSAPTVSYADETAEQFTVTVSTASGTPTGTVTLSAQNNTPVCTASLTNGSGQCAVPWANWSHPATITMIATYSGDGTYAPSVSATQSFMIVKDQTTTTLKLSPTKLVYGHEQAGTANATLTPQYLLTPSWRNPIGPIMFTGLNIYCEDCNWVQLGPTTLPAGVTKIGAIYPGDGDYAASSAPAQPLTVAKATTATVLTLSTAKVRVGHEQAERLAVRVNPQYKGVPGGKVAIMAGRLTLCVLSLTSGRASCALTAKKLGTGTYHLVAVYHGNTDFTASTSARHTLIITR
jgi:hypothetical protein